MFPKKEESNPIIKDITYFEKNIYYTIKNLGKQILINYIEEIDLETPIFVSDTITLFLPDYLESYFRSINKEGVSAERRADLAFREFKATLRDDLYGSLNDDFKTIQEDLQENITNAHYVFRNYFLEKFHYFIYTQIFDLHARIIENLLGNLARNLPRETPEIKKENISKKKENVTRFYKYKKEFAFEDLSYKRFENVFEELNHFVIKIKGGLIEYSELLHYEDLYMKGNSPTSEEKEVREGRIEAYRKEKNRIQTTEYRRSLLRVINDSEEMALDEAKDIMKAVYEFFEKNIRDYKKDRGLFG
jgi:hypothetical protein